ncbi:hypothetical protein GCM10023314_14970 [Algibacter agarivorans]|uniref:Dolichyl-phosphate-mannose-protein mannosyltransferase n=1 Tax=Algibacter agarivorans TaxID=1109741 RepID=A0ABP9GHN5_9FLAO
MTKYLSKPSFIAIAFLCVLLPKIYFLVLSYNNKLYTPEKVYAGGDGSHYLKIAKNINTFGVFSDNNSGTSTESATWRPPLWPYVLASGFYITNNPFGLIIAKSILELMLLIFAFSLIKRLENIKPIHFLIFVILFIEPYYLKYSTLFLSESLTSILVLLLALSFVLFSESKKYSIIIPLLSVITILCHPVSVFFVLALLVMYGLTNLKKHPIRVLTHAMLIVGLMVLWPLRNLQTFNQGLYLTASQGATFSKGWNENVITNYTNVDGDLADEGLNLKYVENLEGKAKNSTLELGKLYKEGTINYIKNLSFKDFFKIIFIKLKSNFNPFPEKPKEGGLESLAIVFRLLYVVLFSQCLFRIFKYRRFKIISEKDKVYLVVFSILIGQIFMAAYIYTGLRFNAIYGLALLFSFIYINTDFLFNVKEKFITTSKDIL